MTDTSDRLEQIREIYFRAKPATIEQDIARAIALLKSMDGEEDRQRASVFMEGLAEMRKEWKGQDR